MMRRARMRAASVLPHSRGAYGPPLPLARTLGAWYRRGPAIRNSGPARESYRPYAWEPGAGMMRRARMRATSVLPHSPGGLRAPSTTRTPPRGMVPAWAGHTEFNSARPDPACASEPGPSEIRRARACVPPRFYRTPRAPTGPLCHLHAPPARGHHFKLYQLWPAIRNPGPAGVPATAEEHPTTGRTRASARLQVNRIKLQAQ